MHSRKFAQALQFLQTILNGRKTYCAAIVALLTSLAGCLDLIPCDRAQLLATGCVGLAMYFQRLATADLSQILQAPPPPSEGDILPFDQETRN